MPDRVSVRDGVLLWTCAVVGVCKQRNKKRGLVGRFLSISYTDRKKRKKKRNNKRKDLYSFSKFTLGKEKKRRRVARSDDSNHVAQSASTWTEWNGTEPKPPSRSFYPKTEIETQIFHKRKIRRRRKGSERGNSSSTFSRDGDDCGIKQLGRAGQNNSTGKWHLTFFLFLHQVYVVRCTHGDVRNDLMNETVETLIVNNG